MHRHLALAHGKLDEFLANPELVESKKSIKDEVVDVPSSSFSSSSSSSTRIRTRRSFTEDMKQEEEMMEEGYNEMDEEESYQQQEVEEGSNDFPGDEGNALEADVEIKEEGIESIEDELDEEDDA